MSEVKFDAILSKLREKDTAATSLKLTDENDHVWQVTVGTSGNLITTDLTTTIGKPYGLLLVLTQPS